MNKDKFFDFVFSMKFTGMLLMTFAFVIGAATFIENDFGTLTARSVVYNALWFEILLTILGINLIGNIFKHKMYRKEKLPIFLFHASFILILIGAAVTRFIGYEGIMHIREGSTVDTMLSDTTHITVEATYKDKKYTFDENIYLSEFTKNEFFVSKIVGDVPISVELMNYIPRAVDSVVEDKKNGSSIIHLVTSDASGRNDKILKLGSKVNVGNSEIVFESNGTKFDAIKIIKKDGKLYFNSPLLPIKRLSMDTQKDEMLAAGEFHELLPRHLNSIGSINFVMKQYFEKASMTLVSADKNAKKRYKDALEFMVKVNDKSKKVFVSGMRGVLGKPLHIDIDGVHIDLRFGANQIKLPFAIELKDFQLERYAGSMSPSSYASEVVLHDKDLASPMPYRIYMNNILNHKGYRFYQSSYDMDELGTVLSVNHDYWGTLITYIGYFIMTLGMVALFFTQKSRFRKLTKDVYSNSLAIALISSFVLLSTPAQANTQETVKTIKSIDAIHAENFGRLLTQDHMGRIKPMDTLSHEIVNKVARTDSLLGLNPNQIVIGMLAKPEAWQQIRMIYVNNKDVAKVLGMKEAKKRAAFIQFFDYTQRNSYILAQYVEEAARKKPALQTQFDKDIIKVDERLNIAYMAFSGSLLRIFPKPFDKNNKWFAPMDAMKEFQAEDAGFIKSAFGYYFQSIEEGITTGNWNKADDAVAKISQFQNYFGKEVLPDSRFVELEILYNQFNIFSTLAPVHIVLGLLLLIIGLIEIFSNKPTNKIIMGVFITLLTLATVAQTLGLGARWIISGHAPWSNGYESMIYIAWATMFAGLLLVRKIPLAIAAASILTGIILFVAHLSWMDPQITNLVPVLKSYWLTIHVSLITASYGFLGLGGLLGLIVLSLMIIRNFTENQNMLNSIKQLTSLNEITLAIGLVLLTIGNFLGGVWANESWGRYWGWDPKETWAAVTILVYAFVLHMRFIPAIKSIYAFNVASVLAFFSVLMTYFGVNYYLAGMHSYAKGDPVPVPSFVYYMVAIIALIILSAYRKREVK